MIFFSHDSQSRDDANIRITHEPREAKIEGVAWYDEMTNHERDLINRFCLKRGLPLIK